MARSFSLVLILGLSSQLASASEFLKPSKEIVERLSEDDIRTSLLEEVEATMGAGTAKNRFSEIKAMLDPIFAALPKNHYGHLNHAAVGYALHRLFVLRHGWHISGLDAKAGHRNSSSPSSPAGILSGQVPAYIEDMFEQRLAGKGFGLNEVAVLASTIEHLIHDEAVSRLGNAYNVHSLPVVSPVSNEDATEVLDTYMLSYILGENIKNLTWRLDQRLKEKMSVIFLAWPETQNFVREIQHNVTKDAEEVGFGALARIVSLVGERFGSFQDLECRQLKDKLVKMEYRGTGRVLLSDFYKPALEGVWTFQESPAYLRSLGLLDESDASQPSLMIANYITSEANCIASSGFYTVCCKSECEGLLGHLEKHIGHYEAKPQVIADLITSLPSSTVSGANKVSASLRQRLDDIAANHNGMVPLHGRLFGQWMHHVYPRECPYPHYSGNTDSELPDEYVDAKSTFARASKEEMVMLIEAGDVGKKSQAKFDLPVEEVMPWSEEEEMFVVRSVSHVDYSAGSTPPAQRSMALVAASASLAFGLIQTLKQASSAGPASKYTV